MFFLGVRQPARLGIIVVEQWEHNVIVNLIVIVVPIVIPWSCLHWVGYPFASVISD
jgi:hypothetical protein